jgi:hypothetical protein
MYHIHCISNGRDYMNHGSSERGAAGSRKKFFLVFAVLTALALPAAGQVNNPAYADYFLIGQFGEVCTMCEVTVLCETADAPPEHASVPESGSFTLYHLQTRTFWSQVSTIWEWFVRNFGSEPLAQRGHTRPVHVYEVTAGQWAPMNVVEGRLVLDPGVIEFGAATIDRVDRRWIDASTSQPTGFCQRLPLWDALEVIAVQSVEAGQP